MLFDDAGSSDHGISIVMANVAKTWTKIVINKLVPIMPWAIQGSLPQRDGMFLWLDLC